MHHPLGMRSNSLSAAVKEHSDQKKHGRRKGLSGSNSVYAPLL